MSMSVQIIRERNEHKRELQLHQEKEKETQSKFLFSPSTQAARINLLQEQLKWVGFYFNKKLIQTVK